MRIYVLFIAALLLASCAFMQQRGSIQGEVFIVTRGAGNIKLGLVEVKAVPSDVFNEHLELRKQEIRATIQERKKTSDECVALGKRLMAGQQIEEATTSFSARCRDAILQYNAIPEILMADLPKDAVSSQTNADGKFSFELPRTKYVLLAKANRQVGGKEESYYWMEGVDISSEDANTILSNNNLLDPDIVSINYEIDSIERR